MAPVLHSQRPRGSDRVGIEGNRLRNVAVGFGAKRKGEHKARRLVGPGWFEMQIAVLLAGESPRDRQTESAATSGGTSRVEGIEQRVALAGVWTGSTVFDC